MVALLVLFFFIFFIGLDYILNHKKYHKVMNQDVMENIPGIGLTMADGGTKIEKKEETK